MAAAVQAQAPIDRGRANARGLRAAARAAAVWQAIGARRACRARPRGARGGRDRLGRCSCAGRRGGRGDPARGRGARERADGLGVLVQLTRCAPAGRDGSRHAHVMVLGAARAGRQLRLGAPEGGASESPRWSGRAVGSRRTAWRLGGRCERAFAESPSMDHPPNASP